MRLNAYLVMIVGFSGCGSSIAALDSLPAGPDVSAAEWPRLVDTPALPDEELLNTQTGERVIERLARQGNEVEARRLRADAVPPVSGQLLDRATVSRFRSDAAPIPAVDEASLLARAAQSRGNTQVTSIQFDESDLLARAARQRDRSNEITHFVDEQDLLARAARQRARAIDSELRVDEGDLLARAANERQRTATSAISNEKNDLRARSLLAQSKVRRIDPVSSLANSEVPRAPQPLRPLDAPVVSSSFEERARRARLRASKVGN